MEKITLYKFNRPSGGVTVSPVKPDGEYTMMVRLVADDGKQLSQDSEHFTLCVDVDSAEGWYEVNTNEQDELADAVNALNLLGVE